MKMWVLSAVAVAVLSACNNKEATEPVAPPVVQQEVVLQSGIDQSNIDDAVRVQDDLFRHVDGVWLKNFQIPADKSNYGSFTKLADGAQESLKGIIEDVANAKDVEAGSEKQKVGDFFKSWMNEAQIEQLGMKPIAPWLAEIDAIKDKNALAAWYAHAQRDGISTPMNAYINNDEKNASSYIAYLTQGGISMPNRDYYTEAQFKDKREAYKAHIAKMFELAGWKDPAGSAKRIYAMEESLAKMQWTPTQNRDPQKTYNKYAIADLTKLSKDFDWPTFIKGLGLGEQTEIVVNQPTYVEGFGKFFKTTSLDDLKLLERWHLLSTSANALPKALDAENFAFFGTTLSGAPEQQPRWKRGVQLIDGLIGEAVGKVYVEKTFSPEAKARMEKLVQNLLKSYGEGINSLEWMSPETKKAAMEKLGKFTYKIGYPNHWRDYSALTIDSGDLFGNLARANEFEFNRNLNKLGKPIDKEEWGMTPQTVNAYYNPVNNEIVFPAAILQPPFFNMAADDAVNYGGIGAVIGHEIGHGFDDQGSQYDGDGNLKNWWTDQDKKEFDERTAKLVAQYDGFEALPGQHVQGKLTLGENIGDLSGMTIAHRAYLLSLEGKPAPTIEGMSAEQRFFYGWAQVWARKYRDDELQKRLSTDPHSPSEFRCNGIVRNMPEFYAAFDVKEGDKLYLKPEDRVKIW